jgi:hypothetical protein
VRYRGQSAVTVRLEDAVIGLAAHADLPQGYLTAALANVELVRDGLRAAYAMAWCGDDDGAARDVWFTVDDDAVYVEAAAPDGRAWLRVRLSRKLFPHARDVATGTTTLRFPRTLDRQLRRVSRGRPTTFVVSPGGADAAIDGSILDERDALPPPAAWTTTRRLASGLAQASEAAPRVVRVPPAALVRPLAAAVAGPRLVVDADPPWRTSALVVDDGARLRALAPLLIHAREVVFVDDGALCTLDAGDVVATVALARGGDAAPNDVVDETAHADADVARALPCSVEQCAAATGTDLARARRALHALAFAGRAFVDVDDRFRQRALATPVAR